MWRPPSPRRNGTCGDRPEDKAGRNRDSRGSRFLASIGKRKSTATGPASVQGYRDLPQARRLAFRCGTETKEGGTKADGIGDSRVARAVPSVCKPCGQAKAAALAEWLTEGAARRRSGAPDRDWEEKTGTNRAGIGDAGSRRSPFVKGKPVTGVLAGCRGEMVNEPGRRPYDPVSAPTGSRSSGRGSPFSAPFRPWSAARPARCRALWAPRDARQRNRREATSPPPLWGRVREGGRAARSSQGARPPFARSARPPIPAFPHKSLRPGARKRGPGGEKENALDLTDARH